MRQTKLYAKSNFVLKRIKCKNKILRKNESCAKTKFCVKTNHAQKLNSRRFELGAGSSLPLYWHLYKNDNSSKMSVAPDQLLQQITSSSKLICVLTGCLRHIVSFTGSIFSPNRLLCRVDYLWNGRICQTYLPMRQFEFSSESMLSSNQNLRQIKLSAKLTVFSINFFT